MGVNYCFIDRRTNIPHATPNYVPVKSKFEVDYCIQTHCSPEKVARIRKN